MASSTLRLDWYSFILGTQISATTGILTSSSYSSMTRLHFPREYLFPTIHNGGNTIIFYRIKETGNWYMDIFRLFCRMLEKNIVGGCLYHIIADKHIKDFGEDPSNARRNTFIFGGLLGICFCFRYNWHTTIWEGIGSGLSAAELSVSGGEIRRLILEDNMLKHDDFMIPIPYDKATFLSGAFTGCMHGIFFSSVVQWIGDIQPLEEDDSDTGLDYCTKCLRLGVDVVVRFTKVSMFLVERYFVGGVLLCAFETLGKKITGWNNSLKILPASGLLLGLYFATDSIAGFQKSWKSLVAAVYSSRIAFALFKLVVTSM